jgi:23S rRNA (cytosine1962-C5)-methyltransferase
MSSLPIVILKTGKDIPVRAGHPWVFSEAIQEAPHAPAGALIELQDSHRQPLGIGMWNPHTSIRVRLLDRNPEKKIDVSFFLERFRTLAHWKERHLPKDTNGYRLVHAEADEIPGLIIDRYANTFVFQLHTAGIDQFRDTIIEALKRFAAEISLENVNIIERSDLDGRAQEGLRPHSPTVHSGTVTEPVVFQEYGLSFSADTLNGQKTGFFLDQREARHRVGTLAKGKRVLNLFGYTGAFSVHALMGGANFVQTVDASRLALEGAEAQMRLNGIDPNDETRVGLLEADIFELLTDPELPGGPYDIIICDPPALAKSASHVPQALKAYTFLNSACLKHLQPGGILVASSCSGRVEPEDFRNALRLAAGRAGRSVRLLDWITQPVDHAERLAFPEGRYLKTAIVEVTGTLS